jgi:VanZ family protein
MPVPTAKVRLVSALAAVAWMALIFRLSALPGSAVPGKFGALGHYGLYAVLGALYLMALPANGRRPWLAALLALALASAYGVTDEFHQSFVPGRVPDVADWLVDTAGALTAVLGIVLMRALRSRSA